MNPKLTITSFVDGSIELAYLDGTRFLLDAPGTHLRAVYVSPFTVEDLATYLVGPVMAFILRLRNILCFHASSLSIHGQAVALCGMSAAGKSTTAAALALRGIPVLTEDVTPSKQSGETFFVEPGYPRICLWPDSVKLLLGSPDALPLLTPNWDKRYLPLDGVHASFEPQPKPLGAIYLLSARTNDSDAPRIKEIAPREALLALVQNTYMNYLLNRDQRAAEFDVLTKLVHRVPVRRIIPHADPTRIAALCDLITEDATMLPAGALAPASLSSSA